MPKLSWRAIGLAAAGVAAAIWLGIFLQPQAPQLGHRIFQFEPASYLSGGAVCGTFERGRIAPVRMKSENAACRAAQEQHREAVDGLMEARRTADAADAATIVAYQQAKIAAWGAAIGALTLFAAAAAAIFAWYAAHHTERGADAARDAVIEAKNAVLAALQANEASDRNARKQLRPYVYPSHAAFTINEAGEPISTIVIQNFGQTPALNKRGWTHSWTTHYPLREVLPEPGEGFEMGAAVVGPGASSDAIQPHGVVLSDAVRREIEAGRGALYVYGFGTYSDTFGVEHEYRFLYFASGEGALERGRLAAYTTGNAIDSN